MIMVAATVFSTYTCVFAQAKKPSFPQMPTVTSPEVMPDGSIVFRILAQDAVKVALQSSDMAGMVPNDLQFTKNNEGVWEAKTGQIIPGAYRYVFTVDGASVVDPRNTSTSESNNNVWSMVYVPGAEFMDMKQRLTITQNH